MIITRLELINQYSDVLTQYLTDSDLWDYYTDISCLDWMQLDFALDGLVDIEPTETETTTINYIG